MPHHATLSARIALGALAVLALAATAQSGTGASPQRHGVGFAPASNGAHPSSMWRSDGGARRVKFSTPIQHIVVIVMENRTPDNLFSGYYKKEFRPGITWGQALDLYNPAAKPTLAPWGLEAAFDPDHDHNRAFKTEAAENWNGEHFGCRPGHCPAGMTAYAYVPTAEVDPYAAFVKNYAFARAVYQANEGPSFAAHQYLVAGQSGGAGSPTAPLALSENPKHFQPFLGVPDRQYLDSDVVNPPGFCDRNSNNNDLALDMLKPYTQNELINEPISPPCEEYPTILDAAVTHFGGQAYADWQYVAHSPLSIWSAPMAVKHLAIEYAKARDKTTQPFAIDGNAAQFVHDVQSKTPLRPFANLTYITPCRDQSDHPNFHGVSDGPKFVAYVVNAIGKSKYWPNTAIFVVWDDWGGWFDHARLSPWPYHPRLNAYKNNPSDPNEWGFRVPLIAISPYVVSPGYVSPLPRSFSALLKYIEVTFDMPSLKTDDFYMNDSLTDMFNYVHAPLPYKPVDIKGYTPPASC
jgi:hypothetical protein